MRALIVEDDTKISSLVRRALEAIHFNVDEVHNGKAGLEACLSHNYDIIILDLKLPDMDGMEILSGLRKSRADVPVLVLSANRNVDDRIYALRAGGDDFMIKPFVTGELQARVEALLRRVQKSSSAISKLNFEDLTVDLLKREVVRGEKKIELQSKEFALLEFLMRHAGRPVSKAQILSEVWNYEYDPSTNIVDVLVFRLRSKIDKEFDVKLIHTIRGAGYVFRAE